MAIRVFYSWQSDLPNPINRGFIEKALDKAIKQVIRDSEVDPAGRPDDIVLEKDTSGLPGRQPIFQAILDRIKQCAIYVPDLTFVGKTLRGRQLPNPNVLIEYGWALNHLPHTRILPVMNTAFGKPDDQNALPFDMRHISHPMTYELDDKATEDQRSKIREKLIAGFASEFQAMLKAGVLNPTRPIEDPNKFVAMQMAPGDALWNGWRNPFILTPDIPFIVQEEKRLTITANQPRLSLRLMPTVKVEPFSSTLAAMEATRIPEILIPMSTSTSTIERGRNEHGAFVVTYDNDDNEILALTQLMLNKEIWGIENYSLNEKIRKRHWKVEEGLVPGPYIEQAFEHTLQRYLHFAKGMRLPLPLKIIAGVHGILGFKMLFPNQGNTRLNLQGRFDTPNVLWSGLIDQYEGNVKSILQPFFNLVCEQAGLRRREH